MVTEKHGFQPELVGLITRRSQVRDSGHWIHRELPEFFNAELLEFLVNL